MVPAYRPVFSHLIRTAAKAKRTADAVKRDVAKDKLLVKLATAIDENEMSLTDLTDFLDLFGVESHASTGQLPKGPVYFRLDNGYWIRRNEIATEGLCNCERATCVEQDEKVYCYFPSHLSPWVIGRRLYHRCYDELVQCPRCSTTHKRGYIGRAGSCASPYSDQEHQVDTQGTETK